MKSLAPVLTLILCGTVLAADASYYTGDALFSKRPDADAPITELTRVGPIGISLKLTQPAFTMLIDGVEDGSPAAKAGLKAGQVIETINGQKLHDIDPRIQLGSWITEAEASDGKLLMRVADKPGGAAREVLVQLPVMGEYSDTWPLNCPKSERIVRNFAEYLKKPGSEKGFADIGMLFLLSTGDESDLAYVAKWARQHKGNASYPWHIGYGGLALCEYYLRTGDEQVLPAIQRMADTLVKLENFGGWAGRGATAQLTYGGGGGHLNAAGTLCVAYLMLAKECGADVPDDTLSRVLTRFFRYSARGNVPYGQGRPEGGYTDNGKNGKLAFSMAAAANLTPDGEDSIYARARDASAQFSFYSTSYMLHGHTGGGIGEIWRSAAMGLMYDKLPHHYREFMDGRRWHYELSRRFDGSFAILGGARYDNTHWGAGYALTYTVPRQTLRLTGAPPTEHSHTYQLPERPWGAAADDAFQSTEPAAYPDGTRGSIAKETLAEHGGMAMVNKLRGNIDADTLNKYIHHPDYVTRTMAAGAIGAHGVETLMGYLKHDDARVRRAALEGLSRSTGSLLTREVFGHVMVMIDDPDESWFVKEIALQVVGKAPADWIVERIDTVLPYLEHGEWWFQDAALQALTPVVVDERCYQRTIPAIGKLLRTSHRYKVVSQFLWGDMPAQLRKAEAKVRDLAKQHFKEAYTQYVALEHPSDVVEQRVNPGMRDVIVQSITKLPGGYDTLYELGKRQHPDEQLPFKQVFLAADPDQLSPELKKLVDETVGGNLIPAYVNKHREPLVKEAASEDVGRRAQMPGLIALYNKVGIDAYNWRDYGPAGEEMAWHFYSYDPPEKWMEPDDRLGRYRVVTFPDGMENWYTPGFDPTAHGWQRGLAPFGSADGEKGRIAGGRGCDLPFCGCDIPVNTLWENDVLLIRGDFEFPPFEEGYRYRLLHGGISHVGSGGGYRLYINGELFIENKTGVDRRGGARPMGKVITKEWWPMFEEGKVTLAAISFMKHHPRTKKYGGNITIFMQRMKVPPVVETGSDKPQDQ